MPQVLVTQYDDTTVGESFRLAHELRRAGLRVDLYPQLKDSYGKQFKYADERRIRYALLASPREVEAGVVAVKNLATGEQVDVPQGEIVAHLQQRLTA